MARCSACGQISDDASNFCVRCGTSLIGATGDDVAARSFPIGRTSVYLSQVTALAIALVAVAIQFFASPEVPIQGLLFCVVLGCLVVTARIKGIVNLGERVATALTKGKERARQGGKFARLVIRPAYAVCNGVTEVTKHISDPFIRTGVRTTLWVIVGSIVVCIVVYITFIVVMVVLTLLFLWFILWLVTTHFDPPSNRPRRKTGPDFVLPGDRVRIQQVRNKPHLVKADVVDQDLGELQRQNYNTQEIFNIFGPNVRIVENIDALGTQDHDRPYHIERSDGKHVGDLVRQTFDDHLKFEPSEED